MPSCATQQRVDRHFEFDLTSQRRLADCIFSQLRAGELLEVLIALAGRGMIWMSAAVHSTGESWRVSGRRRLIDKLESRASESGREHILNDFHWQRAH